jgi:hypothetical protein
VHKFDFHYPHSRIYGHPTVFYEQTGRYFTKDGKEVTINGEEVRDTTLHLKKKNGLEG